MLKFSRLCIIYSILKNNPSLLLGKNEPDFVSLNLKLLSQYCYSIHTYRQMIVQYNSYIDLQLFL